MKKTGLFFWPKQGNVEACANKIINEFGTDAVEMHGIDEIATVDLADFDMLIVGGSTAGADVWEKADETNLWFDFFAQLKEDKLKNKPVALFGLGDQVLYPDHYVDGLKTIKCEFDKAGAKLIGRWPTEGYDFTDSQAVEDNKFFGLALDEDQQDELTDERIQKWVKQIKAEV